MHRAALIAAALLLPLSAAQAADQQELSVYAGKPAPGWHVTRAGADGPDVILKGDAAGHPDALTLQWKDTWFAALRVEGGTPLDLRPYVSDGTLEFDIKVDELARGGIYFALRCGPECERKLPYVVQGRALQGQGWRHLAFALSCFARARDDFSHVTMPFGLYANGIGEVEVANVKFVRAGWPNAACPDYRTQAVTPEPLLHAWSIGPWEQRHAAKLEEVRRLRTAGRNPQVVFVGDSITEGWEKSGKPVWQEYYAKYDALALGFGGDHTENVLWRLEHGEADGIAPKVAVLMIGTNNSGDREDEPDATAAGVKRIVEELRRRLPGTKVLLLAVFPREAKADAFLRRLNGRVNQLIAGLADGKSVFFADINAQFLNPDGSLSRDIMPDLLHPNERGYAIWARSMEPILQRLMKE